MFDISSFYSRFYSFKIIIWTVHSITSFYKRTFTRFLYQFCTKIMKYSLHFYIKTNKIASWTYYDYLGIQLLFFFFFTSIAWSMFLHEFNIVNIKCLKNITNLKILLKERQICWLFTCMYVTTLHPPTPMYIVGLEYAYMCFVLVVMFEFLSLKNIEILYRTLLLLVC